MKAEERVRLAYARIAEVDRPEVWITLRPEAEVLAEAAMVDARVATGEWLPLAGKVAAVKDNIDVFGLPTTAACPAFGYLPDSDAVVVERMRRAGVVVLGKSNMDQFATGLVGTRSPHGAVRDAVRGDYVSGGSSSGSAVAVALGIVDVALATDTAGSGRVPAAFQRVVGLKPTRGLLPLTGVVPADPARDCVAVFAADLPAATELAALLLGPDEADPYSRTWPPEAPTGLTAMPRVGVAVPAQLGALTADALSAYQAAAKHLEHAGATLVEIDIALLLETARLLYDGSFVAARYASFGVFIDEHPDAVDPTIRAIVSPARAIPAYQLVLDQQRVDVLSVACAQLFQGLDAVMLPTTTRQPRIVDVAADPAGENARLGIFTNFCNLLDLCAIAVPAGTADGGGFGVTLFGPAFTDGAVADVAAFLGAGGGGPFRPAGLELAVFGAHLSGHPLNAQLAGGRLVRVISTAPCYRLFALDSVPPKPGLIAVSAGGEAITGELWTVPAWRMSTLLNGLPAPMALGPVRLDDGRDVVGFLCQPHGADEAVDITRWGSWPAYLAGDDAGRE